MKIMFTEASNAQLLYYAQDVLQLDVKQGTHNARLIEIIRQALPDADGIDLGGDDIVEPGATSIAASAGKAYSSDPKIEVFMNASTEKGGDRPVPVSVNGDQILIKRNAWVEIPYRFYLALQDAMQTTFEPVVDNIGKMVDRRAVDSLTFPHNSRNGPSQAVVDKWFAEMAKQKKAA